MFTFALSPQHYSNNKNFSLITRYQLVTHNFLGKCSFVFDKLITMAALGHVFHVEFGFNDTELTRALENKRWALAEKIIVDNSQTSLLDEGCGQRIPLFITLCGEADNTITIMPRNFHIARLLVQHGANVNFRVPETFMSEYLGPGQCALDLVVDFYNQVTANEDYWDSSEDVVIGFNKQPVQDREELIELLCDMLFIMLGHGGDPNITNKNRETLLHRTVSCSMDPHLTHILCENGAHVNALDVLGNTPLISLCAREPEDDAIELKEIVIKDQFMECLLSQKDIQINAQNKHGCNSLFFCLLGGEIFAAEKLLSRGCDPTTRATIMNTKKDLINIYNIRSFSPLLASMCFPKYLSTRTDVDIDMLWKQPVATHHLAHLVDKGYFSKIQILTELHSYLSGDPIMREIPEAFLLQINLDSMLRLGSLGMGLITSMFGGTSASLRQMCMRQIFIKYFLGDRDVPILDQDPTFRDERPNLHEFSLDSLDDHMMLKFLTHLGLPMDLLIPLAVEVFRQKLGSQLMYYAQMHYDMLSGSETESMPSDENESDLEYW